MAFSGAGLRSDLPVAGQLVQGESTSHLEVCDVALGDLYLRTHFLNLSVDRAQFVGECVSHLFRYEKSDVKKLVVGQVDLVADHKSRRRIHQVEIVEIKVSDRLFHHSVLASAFENKTLSSCSILAWPGVIFRKHESVDLAQNVHAKSKKQLKA